MTLARRISALVAGVFVTAALPAHADKIVAGFSKERLARVDALLDGYVNEGATANPSTSARWDGATRKPAAR
jgi:hypothetical protein